LQLKEGKGSWQHEGGRTKAGFNAPGVFSYFIDVYLFGQFWRASELLEMIRNPSQCILNFPLNKLRAFIIFFFVA